MKQKEKKKHIHQPLQNKSTLNLEDNESSEWILYCLAAVFITTFVIFIRTVKFNLLLTWDDAAYITDNSHIKNLTWANIKLLCTNFYVNNYQPLTMLSYAIDYKIGGGHAFMFHFINMLLHLLNGYLVFKLIMLISPKNRVTALITAAFFSVHPMHVESVAWVSERKDVLYTFLFLLSLIMYIKYLSLNNVKYLIYAGIFFILSCLSKSAAVVLPLVMLLLDYYTQRKFSWKIILEKIPLFLVSIVMGLMAIKSQEGAIHEMAPKMSIIEHVLVISHSFFSYLFKALIPVNLSSIYPYPTELGGTLPLTYYLSFPFLIVVLISVIYSIKFTKDVMFGFLFFVITIILVLQFFPVGAATMADRYTYVPYIGLFFMVGKLFEYLKNSKENNQQKYADYLQITLILGFISFSIISFNRVNKWKNDDILFTDAKRKFPDSALPSFVIGDYNLKCYNVINNSSRETYLQKSLSEYENALKHSRTKADLIKAHYNLGTVKVNYHDFQGVIHENDSVLKIDSNYINAYINRGNAKREIKEFESSIKDFNKAIKLSPENALAYSNRGITKFASKDYTGALNDFDKTIKIEPANSKAYNLRGSAKYMLNNYEGALQDYNKAIELDQQYTDAINNRNMVLAAIENSKK